MQHWASRTNTPLQALVTLNDPTFVEAARVFAQKILTQGPPEHDARLAFAFRSGDLPIAHRGGAEDSAASLSAATGPLRGGRRRGLPAGERWPGAREAQLEVAELAAWTAFCNLLLNLDEVLVRE